ncbi:MAG: domain containing protein, partial [Frankiales bacterium]|nr:domain containing protein [Frankiales bacterium]
NVPGPAPRLSLDVVKTNNADGVGGYSPTETSPGPGQDVPYQVVITNNSPITVTLDDLTDVVGAAASVPVTCAPALPPSLASGASATCLFTLVGSSPAAGSSLTDTVTAAAHDPADSNNSTTGQGSSTVLTARPAPPGNVAAHDLSIVKTGPASSLTPGQDASYTLTVHNGGNATENSVVVDDALPANTTLKSITATGWTCTGNAVHCVLNAQLAAGDTVSLTVVLTLAANYADSSVVNTATVGPTDATPSNNTSTVTTPVTQTTQGGGGVTVPTQGGGTPTAGGGTPTAGGGTPTAGGGTPTAGGGTPTAGGGLPFTGAPVQQWSLEGAALLLFGAGLLLLGRRKKATA